MTLPTTCAVGATQALAATAGRASLRCTNMAPPGSVRSDRTIIYQSPSGSKRVSRSPVRNQRAFARSLMRQPRHPPYAGAAGADGQGPVAVGSSLRPDGPLPGGGPVLGGGGGY